MQDSPADHVEPSEVLKALGISDTPAEGATGTTVECKDDVCERK